MELTPSQIKVKELRDSGKEFREIGEILGITISNAKNTYYHATLREKYINRKQENEIERFLIAQASNRYFFVLKRACWILKIKTIADFSNTKEETFLKFRGIGKVGLEEYLRLRDIAREKVKEAEAAEHE